MRFGGRSSFAFALTLVGLVSHTALAAPAPAASVKRVERFEAEFLYKVGAGRFQEYAVLATRTSDVVSGQTTDVSVLAGIRACSVEDEVLSCEGTLSARRNARLRLNGDSTEAVIAFRDRGGRVNRLVMKADDSYTASGRSLPNACGGATVLAYELAYNATARGVLFGRNVSTGGDADPELEAMTRYLEAEVCP